MKIIIAACLAAGLVSAPLHAAQKAQSKGASKTCSFEECVSGSKARGWGGSEASNWCSRNAGKCPPS